MSQSKSADRRTAAVKTEVAAKKAKQNAAKGRLPAMDAYLLVVNPNSNQQRDQLTLLTNAQLDTVRGVIGG